MKIILNFIFATLLTSLAFSQTLSGKERGDRAGLSIRFANYNAVAVKFLPVTIEADIATFAELTLSEKNDLELVKNLLRTILLIENTPETEGGNRSRDSLDVIWESYLKHTALYNKAMKSIENAKNQKQLKEYREILSRK